MTPLYDAHRHLPATLPADAHGQDSAPAPIRCIINATEASEWPHIHAACQTPGRLPAYGIHPWKVAQQSPDWKDALENLLREDPRALIGEIGLDRCCRPQHWEIQKQVFCTQLDLARQWQRCPSIHCVQAWGSLLDCLNAHPGPPQGILIHGFSAPREVIPALLDHNACFSLPAGQNPRHQNRLTELWRQLPPDRILLETDASTSTPAPQNDIRHTYAQAARILGIEAHALALQIEANFHRQFPPPD
jgi:TatD DNase family protein